VSRRSSMRRMLGPNPSSRNAETTRALDYGDRSERAEPAIAVRLQISGRRDSRSWTPASWVG
jgi:hypothetical protein